MFLHNQGTLFPPVCRWKNQCNQINSNETHKEQLRLGWHEGSMWERIYKDSLCDVWFENHSQMQIQRFA